MTSSVDTNSPSLQLFLSQAEDQAPDQSALSGGLPAAQALAFTPKLDLPPKSSVGAFPALSASPNSLKGAGWGLVVPQDPALRKLLLESIQPLLELRAQQMQYASVEQLLAERVYVADPNPLLSETAAKDWFRRVYQEQDKPYDPNKGYKRPPDYLLVLGDLHQVADSIVRVLMQSGCLVGRLAFSDEEGTPQKDLYRRYAEKVRNAEDPQRLLKRGSSSAGVYGVDDGSIATELGWSQMVQPMIQRARQVDDVFHIKNLNKEDAAKLTSREQLWDIAEALPASVLFTMSHGFGGPPGGWENPRYQRRRQGAMSFLNSAQRLTAEAAKSVQRPFLPNGIWFMFACYGAGTPAQSHFYHWLKAMPPEMFGPKGVDWVERALPQQGGDYRPFIAALPQHLLAKEDGPLAFVGHLDLAWSYGFQTARGGSDPAPFVSVLRSLVNGNRLGVAFDSLTQKRLSADGSLLVGYNRIQAQQQRGLPSDWTSADELKRQEAWMTRQDLSGYIILGDPAARLPLKVTWTDADDDEDEGPAVDLSSKSGGQSASPVTVQVPPAMPAVPPVPVSPAVSVTIVTPESASTSAKSAPTASPPSLLRSSGRTRHRRKRWNPKRAAWLLPPSPRPCRSG